MELSGPQVMLYFMGLGDRFISHQYVPVYWGQVVNALKLAYSSFEIRQESRGDRLRDDVA